MKPPGLLTCVSLQKRAEQCASGVSDLAGDLAAEYLKRQGESEFTVDMKTTVVISLVYDAVPEKKVATYCKRYWSSERPAIRRAWAKLGGRLSRRIPASTRAPAHHRAPP